MNRKICSLLLVATVSLVVAFSVPAIAFAGQGQGSGAESQPTDNVILPAGSGGDSSAESAGEPAIRNEGAAGAEATGTAATSSEAAVTTGAATAGAEAAGTANVTGTATAGAATASATGAVPEQSAGEPAASPAGEQSTSVTEGEAALAAGSSIAAASVAPASVATSSAIAPQATTGTAAKAAPSITYRAHVQNKGWQKAVSNGKTAGTLGRALRMEALTVTLKAGGYAGTLQMKAHVQKKGWQRILGSGATMGTTGKGLRVEAVRLAIIGELSRHYDIYYRVHVQNKGWMKWVKNGAVAGTTGQGLRIEAIKIELRKKKTPAVKQPDGLVAVHYRTYVQNKGWQGLAYDGNTAGTTGKGLRVEALRLWVDAGTLSGNIEYRAHVQNYGWMDWTTNGAVAGFAGNGLRVEALQIRLTGDLAKKYDIVYRAHVQGAGWHSNRNNSHTSGTTGKSLRVEALQIQIVGKSQRNGWFNDTGNAWNWYESGKMKTRKWVVTAESPIAAKPGKRRYWVDSSGALAVSRYIDPSSSRDKGSYAAMATSSGYVKRSCMIEYNGAFFWADSTGKMNKPNVSKLVEKACKWAVKIARDNSHGYSQSTRWGPDYDCSSFVIAAFKAAGFNVGNAVYTGNMISELTAHGFVWSTNLGLLQRGDILLVHNDYHQHTELYLGGGRIVGASSSENGGIYGRPGDQTGYEIRETNYYDMPWAGFLRAVLR